MSKYDDLNSVLLEGRLTRDPSLKTFANDSKVCNFSIANNYSYKLKDGSYKSDAYFIDIQVWGNSGALCMQYLTKGSVVRLRGSLKQNKWEDREGKKNSKVVVNAEHVEFREIKPRVEESVDEVAIEDNIDIEDVTRDMYHLSSPKDIVEASNTVDTNDTF